MSLKDFFLRFWPWRRSDEDRLKHLHRQIDSAIEDAKVRLADSMATRAGLERQLQQQPDSGNVSEDRKSMLTISLSGEQKVSEKLTSLISELNERKRQIELTLEQSRLRKRSAEASQMLASVYRDFGSDLELNNFLEKFSSQALKIEYTAESNLRIELLNRPSDQ